MAGKGHILVVGWCLVGSLTLGLFVGGCGEKELAVDTPSPVKILPPMPVRAGYTNDLDRLSQLTNRINRACRGSYVVALGGGGSSARGGPISVDYGLFDKLSDDGAAVLIAEAIAARPVSPSHTQGRASVGKAVLQADEVVGRYIARAGFGSAGFAEWLDAKKAFAAGLENDKLPEATRIAAFIRGYSSERYSKRK